MNYADSNMIFALYKELSGIETDASIFNDFFLENKDVRYRFKEQHVWPKDDVWYKHLSKSDNVQRMQDFTNQYLSSELKSKFKFIGNKTVPDNITLASVIYARFLIVAKEKWNNDYDLLKKIVIFYCHYFCLHKERIDYLKENNFTEILHSLITEASATRSDSVAITSAKNDTEGKEQEDIKNNFFSLLNNMEDAEWLHHYQYSMSNINPLILKLIARYHLLKNTLVRACDRKSNKSTLKNALYTADELIIFVTDMLDIYQFYLPKVSSDKFEPLAEQMCVGDKQNLPAFCGELCLFKATLLLHLASHEPEMTSLLHINYAKKYLLDAEEILSQHLETEKISIFITNGKERPCIKPLLKKVYLYRVNLYCMLAILEQHECRIEDLYQEYIKPCQKAFKQALSLLENYDSLYETTQHLYAATFFDKDSNVLKRIVFPKQVTPDELARGLQQYISYVGTAPTDSSWIHTFQFRIEKNSLEALPTCKTVYSADFDSVLCQSPDDSGQLELSIFQIVASGITIVLQLNQITDNIAMLKLLHNPAFQVLCRKGMIVLSCYGTIMTPETYLLGALQKNIQNFEFSSSKWFNHPRFGMQYRDLMGKCLTEQISYANMMSQLPDMIKEELDFCYDSYRLLLELFTPNTIRQYHQNPEIRYPKIPLTQKNFITLNAAIDSRIKDLREDNDFYPIAERPDFLDFCTIQQNKALMQGYTTRSDYRNLLPDKDFLKQMTPQYQNYWNWFESLINYSYCVSNGSRSSDHIYNTLTHDILRLHPEQSFRNRGTADNLIVKEAFTRYQNNTIVSSKTSNIMELADLLDISMMVRNYNLENADQDKRLAQLEASTGLKYDTAQSGDTLLVDYPYRMENGIISKVTLEKNSTEKISCKTDGIEIQL